jgi:aminomethyltransferase
MTAALQRTALHPEHVAAGARLIDFGGWEMPLHYGSQIDEHHQVRRDAGMFDVSHMLAIDIAGGRAAEFLRHLLANDVAKLSDPGAVLYSCMLDDDGGVLDDLIVYLRGIGSYRVVVNAGTADKDIAWIRERAQPFGADLTLVPRRDLAMLALQGPNAPGRLWSACPRLRQAGEQLAAFRCAESGDLFIARTGYTGEDGFELLLPAGDALVVWRELRRGGFAPCGLGARDTLRLEAGMALYGQDMDASVTPLEAGLGWTVQMGDGRAFVGRDALERRPVRFETHGLVLRDKGVLRAHQPVRTLHGEGIVTSGSFAPTLGMSIALARLPRASRLGDDVQVQIRERWLDARVVRYPFVRRGKSLLAPID